MQEVLLWQTATIRMMYRIIAKAIAVKVRKRAPTHKEAQPFCSSCMRVQGAGSNVTRILR